MKWHPSLVLAIFGVSGAFTSGAPITRAQLVSMAKEKVDARVMRSIVERDCVDFDVDATNAADLSRDLPSEVLEAAIACRKNASPDRSSPAPPVPRPEVRAISEPLASPAPPTPPIASPPSVAAASPERAELRVRVVFIGESASLSCSCVLDGNPIATLTKEEQGKFGEAVERSKIGRQTGYLPLSPGRHALLLRCDPHGQEISVDLDTKAGERQTVAIAETAFRRWKLRKVEKK